ncbi:MAG: sulfite exporter TauE/SafE family protein [Methylophilaceae bacterium]
MEIVLSSVLIGSTIGLVLAVTGAGGASLLIPLLVLILKVTVFEAAPIALLTVLLASSAGAILGIYNRTVRYKTALLIASIGVVIAPLGAKAAAFASNTLLSTTLSCVLLYIGIRAWQSTKRPDTENDLTKEAACIINPVTSKVFWTAPCTKRLASTGAVTGFLSGLLGVGGGFIIVPSLQKVSNFDHQSITATTLAAISLIAMSSLASHMNANVVYWDIAIPLSISATLTMIVVSALLNHKIPEQVSKKSFAIICMVAAIYLGLKSIV